MGAAIDTVSGQVTAPGATLTAWTMNAGDSLTVRNTDLTKRALLLGIWGFNQVAGIMRVRSPKLHDNVQGLRFRIPGNSQAFPLLPETYPQRLYPQDTLIAEQSGSAVGGQIEQGQLLIWYEDLPGVAGRFISPADLLTRGVELLTQETSQVGGVAGGYSGQTALNAAFDLMKANTDYALVGYEVDAQCTGVSWRGADTGNLRVSGPGHLLLRQMTREWFWQLSMRTGLPCIPIFNSANKAGIFVDLMENQAGGTVNVTSIFVELGAGR